MKYPHLLEHHTIGITPVSNGVFSEAEEMFTTTFRRMKERGFDVVVNENIWGQEKARACSAVERAAGLMEMNEREDVDLIMPPWGGHLAVEILEHVDMTKLEPKWIGGYSDVSTVLLAITLSTGIATANMPNIVDLRGEYMDSVTALWLSVLGTPAGEAITQIASEQYQLEWDHEHPTEIVFHLTEQTEWQAMSNQGVAVSTLAIEGRLLGGCIDVIRSLIGTEYGNIEDFRRQHTKMEPVLWYFDVSELDTVDLKRVLVQMKYAGWFDDCAGLVFGRVGKPDIKEDYFYKNVYDEMVALLNVPIMYNVDIGHRPPQMTIVNGCYAQFELEHGKGRLIQKFV